MKKTTIRIEEDKVPFLLKYGTLYGSSKSFIDLGINMIQLFIKKHNFVIDELVKVKNIVTANCLGNTASKKMLVTLIKDKQLKDKLEELNEYEYQLLIMHLNSI